MGPWQSVPANREGGGTDMRGIGRAQRIVVSFEKGSQKTLDCWGQVGSGPATTEGSGRGMTEEEDKWPPALVVGRGAALWRGAGRGRQLSRKARPKLS